MHPTVKRSLLLWTLLLAALSLLLSACSMDSSPVSATNSSGGESQDYRYPPFDPNAVGDGPEPGYRFVHTGMGALGDLNSLNCDSMDASRYCAAWRSNSVSIPLVTVYIPSGVNPHSTTISITAPSGCLAVADFYPHPYQFNGWVQIRWNLDALGLPANYDYRNLVPYYVNDDGDYERMPYTLSGDRETLTLYTNHFSRYILGAPIN